MPSELARAMLRGRSLTEDLPASPRPLRGSSVRTAPYVEAYPVPQGCWDHLVGSGRLSVVDSGSFVWQRRAGLLLAIRYLRTHSVPVFEEPLGDLPQLSKRTIQLALRLFPRFLDRADLSFPVIIAGRGWYQIALDGRHRISKAIWTGVPTLHAVRVPWAFALELLIPGVYEVEWLVLFVRKEVRRPGHRR
jgi:hypothetical protein